MAILIDTNIAIAMREGDVPLLIWLNARRERLLMSILTLVELRAGLIASPSVAGRRRAGLRALRQEVDVVGFDEQVVTAYGHILDVKGFSRRHTIDRLIAATAIAQDLALLTANAEDFRAIPDLRLEVWPAPAQ